MVMEEQYKATPGKKGTFSSFFPVSFSTGDSRGRGGDPGASTSVVGTEQSWVMPSRKLLKQMQEGVCRNAEKLQQSKCPRVRDFK